MAFTRDLGIQFPSDATQAAPSSSQAARSAYRYLARGSRYGGQLGKLSGFEYPLGIHFFKNLMPKSTTGTPEPVEYARFIDARKTKIVDTIKEGITGDTHRAGLDTLIEVGIDPNLTQGDATPRKTFFAKLDGQVDSELIGNDLVFNHGWDEAIWDHSIKAWRTVAGGLNSHTNITTQRAIHGPSNGRLSMPFVAVVEMTLHLTWDGSWKAIFDTDFNGVCLAEILSRSSTFGPDIFYQAISYAYDQVSVTNTIPIGRQLDGAFYNAANIGDPCWIIVEPSTALNLWLIVPTEFANTVQCTAGAAALPIGSPASEINQLHDFAFTDPNAVGAISQAIGQAI